jgi:hypothetical protein
MTDSNRRRDAQVKLDRGAVTKQDAVVAEAQQTSRGSAKGRPWRMDGVAHGSANAGPWRLTAPLA